MLIYPELRDVRGERDWERVWLDKPGFFFPGCKCCPTGCTSGYYPNILFRDGTPASSRYNIAGDSFSSCSDVTTFRNSANGRPQAVSACSVQGVFLTGGNFGANANKLNTFYQYDSFATKTISSQAFPPIDFRGYAQIPNVSGTQCYHLGMDNSRGSVRYDVAGDSWATLTTYSSATFVQDPHVGNLADTIFLAGGHTAVDIATTQIYDTGTNTWAAGTSLPATKSSGIYGTQFANSGSKMWATAGLSGGVKVLTNYQFSQAGGSWSTKTSANKEETQGASAHGNNNDKMFGIGGFDAGASQTQWNRIYDMTGDSWSLGTNTPSLSTLPLAGLP